MARREPVGSISRPSDSGNGGAEVPELIQFVDGQEPQIHKFWDFGDDGVTREVHPTSQVDVGAGVVGEFATNYLTESGRRIPIFGRIYINGSVEWLGVTAANILAPCSILVDCDTTTNQNWVSQPGGPSGSFLVSCNCLVCVLPVYLRKILENMRAAAHRVRDDHL